MGWELVGCFKLGSTLGECMIFTFMGRGLRGQEVLFSNAWIELFVTMIGFSVLQTTLSFIYQNYLRPIVRSWLSVSLVLLTLSFKLRGLRIISLVSLLMKPGIRSLTIMMLPKASRLVPWSGIGTCLGIFSGERKGCWLGWAVFSGPKRITIPTG